MTPVLLGFTHVLSIGTAVVFRLFSESRAVAGTVVPVERNS